MPLYAKKGGTRTCFVRSAPGLFSGRRLLHPGALQTADAGSRAVLPPSSWVGDKLQADGVQRFFIVCGPTFAEEVRRCFPADADVIVSEQQKDLMEFLNTPDQVLVLSRAALPLEEAGVGFVYRAPGYELQGELEGADEQQRLPSGLASGWLPVYGPETIAGAGTAAARPDRQAPHPKRRARSGPHRRLYRPPGHHRPGDRYSAGDHPAG